jgi:hypothetical protein
MDRAGLRQMFSGEMLDVTPNGAFFLPTGSYINNIPMKGNNYCKMIPVGDQITINFGKVNIKGKVVWMGNSSTHQATGFGIEFM